MKKINRTITILTAVLMAVPLFMASFSMASAKESATDNYKLYCVQCHGTKGIGKGINAPFLSVQPRNHTSAKDMGELSDDNVFKAIKSGGESVGKSTQMPSWAAVLTDEEIHDMVKHLRKMCKCEGKK